MKYYLVLAASLLPMVSFAQPLNVNNNPNLPDYQNPSQQRLQTQMQSQQIQQKGMLSQQLQTQTRVQQQNLQTQINNNTQRTLDSSPGRALAPRQQQTLPNNGSSMLSSGTRSANGQERFLNNSAQGSAADQSLEREHLLPQNTSVPNRSDDAVSSMPQPDVPLKTVTP